MMALSNAMPGISRLDAAGRYEYVNESYAGMLGYGPGEMLGLSWEATVHPDDLEAALAARERMLREGQVELEARAVRKNGSRFHEHALMVRRADAEGRVIGHFCFMRDVTDRKRAEERFRLAVEASPSAFVMVDRSGHIVLVNSQTEAMFGYRREDLLGQPVERLVPARFRSRHPQDRREFFERPEQRPMGAGRDLFGLRQDGTEFPVEIGLNPIETEEGFFVLSAIVDITERKGHEEAVRRANEELVRKNREIEEFVDGVSHDLKSPLVTIGGLLGVLNGEIGRGEYAGAGEIIKTVEQAVEKMRSTINDLLRLSRVGRVVYEPELVDVAELVGDSLQNLGPDIQAQGMTAEVDLAGVPPVLVDRARAAQVFDNLIVNAIHHAGGPGRRLTIGGEADDADVRVFVRDDGPGIEPQYHEKVFEPFQRLNTHTEGTGIGLTIVKRIMEAHGGRVWLHSAPGAGATLWLAFPRRGAGSAVAMQSGGRAVHGQQAVSHPSR